MANDNRSYSFDDTSVVFVHEEKFAGYIKDQLFRKINKSKDGSRLQVHEVYKINDHETIYEGKHKQKHYFYLMTDDREKDELIYLQHVITWKNSHDAGLSYQDISETFDYSPEIIKALVEYYEQNSYLRNGILD